MSYLFFEIIIFVLKNVYKVEITLFIILLIKDFSYKYRSTFLMNIYFFKRKYH